MFSGETSDVQEVNTFNTIIRWTNRGIELEADPRHAEIAVWELGFGKVPGAKADGDTDKLLPKVDGKIASSQGQANTDAGAARTYAEEPEEGLWQVHLGGHPAD